MKKIFLFTVLLFQLTISFGQKPQWGPWTTMACYKGIQYRVANLGYDKSTNKYWWNVRWKNNYSKAVSFDGQVIINGENSLHGGFGNIQPGGISTYTSLPYKSSSTNFTVSVNNVCFANSYGGCSATLESYPNYAECDNGTPNYKINAKKSANTNSNSNSQGTSNQNSSTGSIDEQIKSLTKRRNELCLQVVKIDQNTYNNICDSWQGRNQLPTKEQTLAYLKEDIRKLQTRLNANGNTTTNTSKNDLTEYNLSKADLERQTHERNQEIVTKNAGAQVQQQEQPKASVTAYNNTIKDFMQSIPNVKEDKETLDKMKNFELAKLEVEPEFNTISSPNDYNKVSLTTISYQNLEKKGNIAVSIITSALSNVDKAKDKAFTSAKIQTAFLGANTLFVKVMDIGSKTLGGPYNYPTTDVFGIAYSDKKINFEILKQTIDNNKNFKIIQCLSHTINTNDIKVEKCDKTISITEITKKDEKVKVTANIDGVKETSFTVTNFNSEGFTLMYKEEVNKKQKLYNFIIKSQ